MHHWQAKRKTEGKRTDGTVMPISRGRRVSSEQDFPLQPTIRFWIDATGENLWLEPDRFFVDFERVPSMAPF
jgi:hypothetical protein